MRYFLFVFILFVSLNKAYAFEAKKIFVLHSYSQEYEWTKKQHEGFIKEIKQKYNQPLEISTEYLDTKRIVFEERYKKSFLEYLTVKYKNYTPDAIYVTDDNALSFASEYFATIFDRTPVVFSGINDLSKRFTLDKSKYTGVFEVKEIEPNLNLIHTFSPQTRDIWFVGDNSSTHKAIVDEINTSLTKFPKYSAHIVADRKISTITKTLQTLPQRTFVVLTTIGGFSEDNGNILTLQESIQKLMSLKNIIIISMEDAYVQGGIVGGYVTDGIKQGSVCADMVIRILSGNQISEIPSVLKGGNSYIFDKRALVESRLILSEYISRISILINKEDPFFIRHQQLLLSVFLQYL